MLGMQDEQKIIKIMFGKQVRKLREERGHSQEELADLCELDRTYIGGVERGERNVSLVNIIRISSGLKVETTELFAPFSSGINADA